MTQSEFNLIIKAVIFTSSTDSCMGSEATVGLVEALKTLVDENSELMGDLDLNGLYIYGLDPQYQEDSEINKELFEIFQGKLDNRGL